MAGRISRDVNEIKEMLRQEGLYLIESPEDTEKMLDVMVEFYYGDALFNWFCGGEYDRHTSRNILRAGVASMPYIIAYADSPEFKAVAAWVPPGNKALAVIPYLKNGGYDLYKERGMQIVYRLFSYQNYAGKIRKSITGKKDWYLFSFAVDSRYDCNEYSQKILRPMTKYGWERGEACYSEVNSDKGINYMRAAGFQVREQGKLPGGRVNHYGVMV